MNNTYFYGIDFKKINLSCKVNLAAINVKEIHQKELLYFKIDLFYKVQEISFPGEILSIQVFDKKSQSYVQCNLSFNQVEFSYYFDEKDNEVNNTVFYGIDFNKIRVYCKVNLADSIKLRAVHQNKYDERLDFKMDHYYEVQEINFPEELLSIQVFDKRSQSFVQCNLSFNMVEFAYYFVEIKKEELNASSF